ncbi:MAG: hypothetical protein R2861_01195 [Desulfobacterales bacterium]
MSSSHLEERQKEGDIVGQAYQHPCSIDLSQLKKLMGSLTCIQSASWAKKKMPVFQAIEIERLARSWLNPGTGNRQPADSFYLL